MNKRRGFSGVIGGGFALISCLLCAQTPPVKPVLVPTPKPVVTTSVGTNLEPVRALPPRPAGMFADMTEEQKAAYRQLSDAARKASFPLSERLRAVRREMQEMIYATKLDENALSSKAAEIGKIEAEIATIRAREFGKVRAVFTAEQIERMKTGVVSAPAGSRPDQRTFIRPVTPAKVDAPPTAK